jgi:acetyl-CoA synthetase
MYQERRCASQHQLRTTHAYPREIDFVAALPKTPSGKIQRFILRGVSAER